jgi:cytochrome c oxidase subunit 2
VSGDVAAGKVAYAVCAACHGQQAEGNEQMGGPALAGQDDWYLVRQIDNYRKGLRGYHPQDTFGLQMRPMAATLTSAESVNNVVAYINILK